MNLSNCDCGACCDSEQCGGHEPDCIRNKRWRFTDDGYDRDAYAL